MFPLSLHPEGARLPNLILPVLNEMFILQQALISLNITPLRFFSVEEAEGPGLTQSDPGQAGVLSPSLCPCLLVLSGDTNAGLWREDIAGAVLAVLHQCPAATEDGSDTICSPPV